MDDTLDSIRPSDVNCPEEMSYLFGRDPSILAYGQRPFPSKDTKKNLLSLYEVPENISTEKNLSSSSESQSIQTVKVYLRMKPFPKKLKLSVDQAEAYKITNGTTLFTRLPTLDQNTSCLKRSQSSDVVCRKFTFTKTFGPETTQLELFEQAVKQQMVDFLTGQNSTIMTYGTTNSGKSYTLQGTPTSPGIIPRGLEFVFCNITPKSTPSYKVINHCDVVCLDPLERAQELEIKTKLLTFASMDKHQYINTYKEMQKLLQEESPIRPSHCVDAHYSVWVSFAEIYNETVYDLLSNECQKKRTPLKLATDSQGRAFIKGLKTVCVNSGSEAYQVLMAGQYNLKVAATALNARSSRSHCIFTIRLLKYYLENAPESVEVSTFAFCDLAGSERLKKTLNIGDRLKEAQNINTSLLVLGRCLKSIHEGQLTKQKAEHIGPFRESKLTRLFQRALSGKEYIALVVNINPLPNLYVETQNVLSFSAIAKKIIIEQKQQVERKRKSRFSKIVTQSIETVTNWDTTELEREDWHDTYDEKSMSKFVDVDDYEEVLTENNKLKKEIAALQSSALARDLQTRKEMADAYTVMIKDLESDWKNRIKDIEEQQADIREWSVKQVEDYYKQKLDQLSSRKRRRSSRSEESDVDYSKNVEELESENSRLTSRIVFLKNNIEELKAANETLNIEKNNVAFELGLLKEEAKSAKDLLTAAQKDVCSDDDTKLYVDELQSQLFAKQEQVKKLKVFLNEAKEEYIAITTEMRDQEYLLKVQKEALVESEEKIEDLEEDLVHANFCLTEKTKAMEVLEEKLDSQSKKLVDSEKTMQEMEDQIKTLKQEKLNLFSVTKVSCVTKLCNEVELLRKTASSDDSVKCVEDKTIDLEQLHNGTEIELDKTKEDNKEQTEIVLTVTVNSDDNPDLNTSEKSININCSVNTPTDEGQLNVNETNVDTKGSQTVETETKEEVNQTSFVDESFENEIVDEWAKLVVKYEDLKTQYEKKCLRVNELADGSDEIVDEWAKLTVKYEDVKTQYKQKCLREDELADEILYLNDQIEHLTEHSDSNKVVIEEYKQSIELLQKELSAVREEKTKVEEILQYSDNVKVALEKKVIDFERRLVETEKELSTAKDNHKDCMEKLKSTEKNLDEHMLNCKNQQEETITELQKQLSVIKEKHDIKAQCLDVHAAKIVELEQNFESVAELQETIIKLNRSLEVCQKEKERLQLLLDENNEKLLDFEDRLERAQDKEREKDAEINSLQQEMKRTIQRSVHCDNDDKVMETEIKKTIQQLTQANDRLAEKEEYIESLQARLKTCEQHKHILDLLQETADEKKKESEKLRTLNDELKKNLIEKEREIELFMKHRDEMVSKYEVLVKNQQEELEKLKKQSSKQTSRRKEKDDCENTSEDDVALKVRPVRRGRRYSPLKSTDISVIDLSGSETKRNVRRAALPPPSSEPASEKKATRKKKLFVTEDDSSQDIEPLNSAVSITPPLPTRSLRTRRK